jgi:phytol kinase
VVRASLRRRPQAGGLEDGLHAQDVPLPHLRRSGGRAARWRPLLNLFGGATTLVLSYALVRGAGDPLYEALAREKDVPYRTWYIVVPYLATLAGGLAANALAGATAVIGYLVCGIGDAVGEPIGTRFGRHTYRVLAPGRVVSYRSLEGSCAVAVCS